VHQNAVIFDLIRAFDTIRYDSVYLTCSRKLTGSQLSLTTSAPVKMSRWCLKTVQGLLHWKTNRNKHTLLKTIPPIAVWVVRRNHHWYSEQKAAETSIYRSSMSGLHRFAW